MDTQVISGMVQGGATLVAALIGLFAARTANEASNKLAPQIANISNIIYALQLQQTRLENSLNGLNANLSSVVDKFQTAVVILARAVKQAGGRQ